MSFFIVKIKIVLPGGACRTKEGFVVARNAKIAKELVISTVKRSLIMEESLSMLKTYFESGKGLNLMSCKKIKEDFVIKEGDV